MSSFSTSYLVLGGGIAGVSAAQTLHLLDSEADITLVTATELVKTVTELTHLTKLLSSFNVIEKNIEEWQNDNKGIRLVKGVVTDIDREKKIVALKDQSSISYNKLCICTGGSPKTISDNPHVLGIRDTQSVRHFQEKLKSASRVMVVGNGGIATEIVFEITNIHVIWTIKDSSISSVFVDAGAGEFLVKKINSNETEPGQVKPVKRMKFTVDRKEDDLSTSHLGSALGPDWHKGFCKSGKNNMKKVHVEYEVEVKHIWSHSDFVSRNLAETDLCDDFSEEGRRDWNVYVELTSGKVFGCDFVVSATGVSPAGEMFRHVVEVDSEGGILVDEQLRTSQPDIYAAGDVCTAAWPSAPHWLQMRLWCQARQLAMMAARAMVAHSAGENTELDFCFEMFAHVTHFFGYKVVLLGLYNGQKLEGQYDVLLRVTPGVEYVKAVMKDGKMQGALLIGQTDLEETFENLILNQLDLSAYGEDLLDPNIDIEDYFD